MTVSVEGTVQRVNTRMACDNCVWLGFASVLLLNVPMDARHPTAEQLACLENNVYTVLIRTWRDERRHSLRKWFKRSFAFVWNS